MKKNNNIFVFMLILSFIFTSIISAQFSPEKEIKTIQTLPRKPQATLDIEVTKLNTEVLQGRINEKLKTITVDFQQLKTVQQGKKLIDKSQYDLFIFDNLETLPLFTSQSNKNKLKALKNIPTKLYSYSTNSVERDLIDIKYDEIPKILYLGIKNNTNNSIEKIYTINNFIPTPRASNFARQIGTITNPVKYQGGTTRRGAYPLLQVGGLCNDLAGSTSSISFSQWEKVGQAGITSVYPFIIWTGIYNGFNSGAFYGIRNWAYGGTNISPYPNNVSINGNGWAYIQHLSNTWTSGNNAISILSNNTNNTNSRLWVGIEKWDLIETTVLLFFDRTDAWESQVQLTLKPTPKLYYDDAGSSLKRYVSNNNIITQSVVYNANLTTTSFNIGTVKLNTEDTLLLENTPNSGLRFFPGETNSTFSNVIYLQDTSNNKTLVLQGTIGAGLTESSTNKNPRNYILKIIRVYNGLYNNSSPSFPAASNSTLQIGEVYKNANTPLFQLGISSTKSYTVPFYDDTVYGNLTLNVTGGAQTNTTFTIKNPIPKALSNGTGTYKLITGNTNPNGLSTNQNTLLWTTPAINATTGYTQYNSIHKIGIWFVENGTTVKAASFTTDNTGKINSSTRTGTASIGGNIYSFGDFYTDGTLSMGLQSWNFSAKNGVQMKVLHFTSDKDPLTALESDAFASDTFTFNIDALNPETYYKINPGDASLITQNGTVTGTITNATTPVIYLGKIQTISTDKNITIDTNTIPTNPNGITFTSGETITLKGQTTGTIITGIISLSGTPTEDSIGRDVYITLPSVFNRSDTYKTENPTILTNLGIKATTSNPTNSNDIYYSIINNLILNPATNYTSSVRSLRLNNPVYLSPNNTSSTQGIYLFGNGTNPFTAYNTGSRHTATFTDAPPNSYGLRVISPFNITTNVGLEGNHDLSSEQGYKYTTGLGTANNVIGRSSAGHILNNLWETYTAALTNAFFLDTLTSKGYNTKFGNINGTSGGVGIGITNWDYGTAKRFNMFLKDTGSRYDEQFHVYIPPFKTEAYYDNITSTIKIDNESGEIDQSKYWSGSQGNYYYSHNHSGKQIEITNTPGELLAGIKLGSIKIYDSAKIPQLPPSNRTLQFKYLSNITLTNSSGETIIGDLFVRNGGTTLNSPIDAATYRTNLIDLYFKATTISSTHGNSTYTLSNSNLLSLGIAGDSNYDSSIIEKITIVTLPSPGKSSDITFKNPIPKGMVNNSGTYLLNGSTNPIGLSTNLNTLVWNSPPINSINGYTSYNVAHKIGIWFEDNGTVIKAASFNTDNSGNITTLISGNKTVNLNGNTYIFNIVNGILNLGINQWNFLNKSNVKMKIIHYAANFNPLIDDESKGFDTETITININALTPETYYYATGTIVNGGTITAQIPISTTPTVYLGKVQIIPDDRTLTADTNSTPINPNGVTFTNNEVVTLKGIKNPSNIISGTISISGTESNDSSGRDVYLNFSSNNFDRTDQYIATNVTLTQLGIKATINNPTNTNDIYYPISSDLILNPIFDISSKITFKNPIPKALNNGTGTYLLNGSTNPTGLSTNQNTLTWTTNNAPSTGMTIYPSTHKIGVWISDGSETQKLSFITDATGKLTGTKTGTLTVGGNTYIFGDFNNDGNFSLGLQNWNFLTKNDIQISILHFDNSLDPLTATEAQAFGRDQFSLNIESLTPKTYFYENISDNSLIHENGIEIYDIPISLNPKIKLGKVQTISDDKTITITPTNPSGVTFISTNESITFTGTINSSETLIGTISIDGDSNSDNIGRDIWLNISGIPIVGESYKNNAANLIKLGITTPDISYTLVNDITLNAPTGFLKNSEISLKNPLPKGLDSGIGTYHLDGINKNTNPTGFLTTNLNTLNWITSEAPITGMTLVPSIHKIGVWISDGNETQKLSFITDITGKLTGTKTGTLTVGGNTYIFGDFNNDGNFSLGLQSWNYSFKSNVKIKILHFTIDKDAINSNEVEAFGKDIFTLNIDAFNPELYYSLDGTINNNDILNLNTSLSVNPEIILGTVKTISDENTLIENFDFYLTNTPLIFKSTTNPQNTATGNIAISDSASQNSTGRLLTLNITSGSLKPGEIYKLDNAELVRLGRIDNYFSLINTLNITSDSSFIVSYNNMPSSLDFGATISNENSTNEAKSTLNILYASKVGVQNVDYSIKLSSSTTDNVYTDFKLHPNGIETVGDFVTADIWLSNEIRDSSNPLNRSININGKIKDISNASVNTNSVMYHNIVEVVITLK